MRGSPRTRGPYVPLARLHVPPRPRPPQPPAPFSSEFQFGSVVLRGRGGTRAKAPQQARRSFIRRTSLCSQIAPVVLSAALFAGWG